MSKRRASQSAKICYKFIIIHDSYFEKVMKICNLEAALKDIDFGWKPRALVKDLKRRIGNRIPYSVPW